MKEVSAVRNLLSQVAQAVRNCPVGKMPIVVVHVNGRRHRNDMVVLQMRDFEDLLGEIRKG